MLLKYASCMGRHPQSDKSALSPAEILADPTASFGGLLERANLLMQLERLLRTLLEPALRSVRGARIARRVCERLGLDPAAGQAPLAQRIPRAGLAAVAPS